MGHSIMRIPDRVNTYNPSFYSSGKSEFQPFRAYNGGLYQACWNKSAIWEILIGNGEREPQAAYTPICLNRVKWKFVRPLLTVWICSLRENRLVGSCKAPPTDKWWICFHNCRYPKHYQRGIRSPSIVNQKGSYIFMTHGGETSA